MSRAVSRATSSYSGPSLAAAHDPSAQPTRSPGLQGPDSLGVTTLADPEQRAVLRGLLEAARELRPTLLAEQAAAEERGAHSPRVHEAMVEAGFFRTMQPRSMGGFELGVEAYYQLVAEVGRGCASTAWSLCLSGGHVLTLASYWPEQAQREIFGEHGHIVCPASGNPQRDVEVSRVEGGYRVSGTWRFCSGAPYSTHFMPSFTLDATDGSGPTEHWAVVPRSSFTVLDDWGGGIGLKASGSNSIRVNETFVPDHHVVQAGWSSAVDGPTAGSLAHGNTIYGGNFTAFAEGEVGAVIAGLVRAALDEYEQIITSSNAPRVAEVVKRSDHPEWQRLFGRVMAMVDSVVALSVRGGQLYDEYSRRSVEGLEPFGEEKGLRLNNFYLAEEEIAYDAIDLMLRTAGTRHSTDGARLQRYFRDMVACRTRTDQLDMAAGPATTAHLGV